MQYKDIELSDKDLPFYKTNKPPYYAGQAYYHHEGNDDNIENTPVTVTLAVNLEAHQVLHPEGFTYTLLGMTITVTVTRTIVLANWKNKHRSK